MFKNSYKDITSKIVEKRIGSKATNSVLFNSNVKLIRLTSEELNSVHKAFDDNKGVDDDMLKVSLNEHILPRFKNELGWTNIRSINAVLMIEKHLSNGIMLIATEIDTYLEEHRVRE